MKVYIVSGFTGEYSDYTEWIAKAYIDEIKAKDYLTVLNNKLKEMDVFYDEDYELASVFKWNINDKKLLALDVSTLDERFKMDYTGTGYKLMVVEVEE